MDTPVCNEDKNGGADSISETLEKQAKWEKQQIDLKAQMITEDTPEVLLWRGDDEASLFAGLHYVGGVDISFRKESPNQACAMLVVLSYPELEVVYETSASVTMTEPYIAGFLAFREVDFLLERLSVVRSQRPDIVPQVILVDGNGILHHRGFGLACHLGVKSGIPCVGVGKNLLHVDGLLNDKQKTSTELLQKGDYYDLVGESGMVYGRALKTSDGALNPVYVSVGHRISLDTATKLVTHCSISRIPEPVRQADILSREKLRQ